MQIPPLDRKIFWGALLLIAALALALRLTAIGYGLPQVFNADEPHHVNIAVSFGRGSLHPGMFKYPTLWMYVLFAAYGAYYLAWSGFGFFRSAADFAALFAWNPGAFYLIGRLLSVAFGSLGLGLVVWAGKKLERPRVGLWAAALLSSSWCLVDSAHALKPDSIMFFFAALAWLLAFAYLETGSSWTLYSCAAATGFCVSTQYVAAPFAVMGPVAWAMRRLESEDASPKLLAACGGVVVSAFFLGSPFVLLDWNSALRDIADTQAMARAAGSPAGAVVLKNLMTFADPFGIAGILSATGLVWLIRSRTSLALAFAIPIAAQAAFLAFSPNGGWPRFLIPVYPALALAAGFSIESVFLRFAPHSIAWRAAFCAALLAPGASKSWAFVKELSLPDTREAAKVWIEGNIPAGAAVATFSEHAVPALRPSLDQVRELLARTRESGHPRARLYEVMERSHPGGGYRVMQIEQDADILHSGPRHVKFSAAARETIDVSGGLSEARARGAEYFIYSSWGSSPKGFERMRKFLDEAESEGKVLGEFSPEPELRRGPLIRVIRIATLSAGRAHGR